MPALRREHDFQIGHLAFFDTFGLGAVAGFLGFLLGCLRALLASLRVLLVALRCLLGFSWVSFWELLGVSSPPIWCWWCSKTTFKQDSHLKRRFLKPANSLTGLLLFLMPGGWVWELKTVPRKVRRV